MARLFGTDGIRGKALKDLEPLLALKIGASTVRVLKEKKEKLTFLIGTDTRISKDVLKYALASGILGEGANVIDLEIIPTPAVAYLIKKYHADGGFVISASHNPYQDNGIKIFNEKGYKLADNIEEKIEEEIINFKQTDKEINCGTYMVQEDATKDYINYLLSTTSKEEYKNLKIGVDCANGASYASAKLLFDSLGCEFTLINATPDGYNINENAGSTHIEGLRKLVLSQKLDCGIAFDGDADRCLMVDEEGNIIDGDQILAMVANNLKKESKLKNNTLVGTVMSNLGIVKFCEREGINFVTTKVGDRYVLENMLQNDYIIGGEQSGHIIFKEYATTGDGELTALQILNLMVKSKEKLSKLASVMEKYPQVLKNVEVSKEGKENYKDNQQIMNFIEEKEKELNGTGRILVRPSGTENLIRVMIEGKNIDYITKMCDDICKVIKEELK